MRTLFFIIMIGFFTLSGCVYARYQPENTSGTDTDNDNANSTRLTPIADLPQNQQVWTTPLSAMTVSSASGRLQGTLSVNPNSVNRLIERPRYQLSDPILEAKRIRYEQQMQGESP